MGPGAHFLFVLPFVSQDRTGLPIDTNQIAEIIEPSLDAMGYRLVRVAVLGAGRMTLQVMAERRDDAPMSVDDCADISRTVSALLDVADPIAGAYTLEISSPGMDRALKKQADYERFTGRSAKIWTDEPVEEMSFFEGRLVGVVEQSVRLELKGKTPRIVELPLALIRKAHLVVEF